MTTTTATTAADRRRLSRRRLLVLGMGVPLSLVSGRVAIAGAHEGSHGESTPEAASPEASPAANTGTAAAYMTIQNAGDHSETLLGARTDVARSVELHQMTMSSSGVMSMQPVPSGVEIPAGEVLDLAPQDGYHFMLVDLAQDLLPNTTYDMVLTFAQAGEVAVTVAVQMIAPTDTQVISGRGQDVSVFAAWSRPAPRIDGVTTSSDATPAASPDGHHHG